MIHLLIQQPSKKLVARYLYPVRHTFIDDPVGRLDSLEGFLHERQAFFGKRTCVDGFSKWSSVGETLHEYFGKFCTIFCNILYIIMYNQMENICIIIFFWQVSTGDHDRMIPASWMINNSHLVRGKI